MVKLTAHDLTFILKQIKIAEAHAAGGDLKTLVEQAGQAAGAVGTGAAQAQWLPYGLRAVDGTYNNLLNGREEWGAADNPFVQLGPKNWGTEPDDAIDGGDGDDFIYQTGSSDGRDMVDGGAGADTYVLMGSQGRETFRIFTRDAAVAAGLTGLALNTEIEITRGGAITGGNIIAELDNIQEIKVNALNTTANNENNLVAPDGGTSGGDTILVIGDFRSTSLDYNTIRVEGTGESDTVDISGLESAHRVVLESNGGVDTLIGQVRNQDIFTGDNIVDQRTDDLGALLAAATADLIIDPSTADSDLDFLLQTDVLLDTELGRTMIMTEEALLPLDIVEDHAPQQIFVLDKFLNTAVRHTSEDSAYILS